MVDILTELVVLIGFYLAIVIGPHVVAYIRSWRNKEFLVKRITLDVPTKFGDACFIEDKIILKNFRTKTYSLQEISIIEVYQETTMGLEEFGCIDVFMKDGAKLLMDPSKDGHRELLNRLLTALNIDCAVLLEEGFWFFLNRAQLYNSDKVHSV